MAEILPTWKEIAESQARVLGAVLAERDRLREFVVAHTLLEKGITDFDLHHEAVTRFERASDAVADVIREALVSDLPPHDHTIEPGEVNRRGCQRCEIEALASGPGEADA